MLISNDLIQEGNISTDGRFEGEKGNFVKQIILCVLASSGKVYILYAEQMAEGKGGRARLCY
ncbi:Uncharacterised protein [Streptococcus merionis]|uniref:Uncharacterized protein n=1 Tax=Streptococcus merionis TaxID=400065 RepID=A0A239SXF5_9STRE|nr:Uncharacterised protein [Streptococcus merionis]